MASRGGVGNREGCPPPVQPTIESVWKHHDSSTGFMADCNIVISVATLIEYSNMITRLYPVLCS